MEMSITENKSSQAYISEFAVIIKKMRLLRKLRRKQAAHFLPFDHKNIERLENGRGNISIEQFKLFQDVYGSYKKASIKAQEYPYTSGKRKK